MPALKGFHKFLDAYRWPQLNSVKKGRKEENIFKNHLIEKVISEYPEFLSVDFVKTLGKLK